MAVALIAAFSQTGATRKIADHIAVGMRLAGWQVDMYDITSGDPPNLDAYDVIGIGSPTYFYRPPFIVTDFVKALPPLKGKTSFVFITHGTEQGACGNRLRSQLKRKGARDLGYYAAFGADYWLGYMARGYLFSPDAPSEKELEDGQTFGLQLVRRYRDPGVVVEPYDGPTPLVYALERFLAMRPAARWVYGKTFRADDTCIRCGQCAARCPVDNITLDKDKKPVWHNRCLLCASCQLVCPQEAIHSALGWRIFSLLMDFNIRRARRRYPYAEVEHKGGKTRRL